MSLSSKDKNPRANLKTAIRYDTLEQPSQGHPGAQFLKHSNNHWWQTKPWRKQRLSNEWMHKYAHPQRHVFWLTCMSHLIAFVGVQDAKLILFKSICTNCIHSNTSNKHYTAKYQIAYLVDDQPRNDSKCNDVIHADRRDGGARLRFVLSDCSMLSSNAAFYRIDMTKLSEWPGHDQRNVHHSQGNK